MGAKHSISADTERIAFSLISDSKVLKEAVAIVSSGGTRDDISRALNMPMDVVGRLFAIYDVDQNNKFDPIEVLQFVKDLNHGTNFIACYFCNEIIKHSCYGCQTCQWEYKLCQKCHDNEEHKHAHELTFLQEPVSQVFANKLRGMPKELGLLKAIEIQRMFEEVDRNKDGKLTLVELNQSQSFQRLLPGMTPEKSQALLRQFDTDHNLSLDPVEFATCVAICLGTTACVECNKKPPTTHLRDMASALRCCKKEHDYVVCKSCFNAGKVRHECVFFERLGMFNLGQLGLAVSPKGSNAEECYLEVTNTQQWRKWRPFYEPIIANQKLIYLHPKHHTKKGLDGNGVFNPEVYYITPVLKVFNEQRVHLVDLIYELMSDKHVK